MVQCGFVTSSLSVWKNGLRHTFSEGWYDDSYQLCSITLTMAFQREAYWIMEKFVGKYYFSINSLMSGSAVIW